MSEEQKPPMIYGKIADCIADVGSVGKDHKNQQQNYSFRSIDDFYDAMQPVLAKHRLFIAPTILEHTREERTTKSGGALMTTITKVRYKIFAEDGSFIEADALGEGADSGDKSANKAAAGAIKYLFMQVFAVRVNGENLDSERESHDYTPKATKTPPVPKPAPKPATSVDVLPKVATEATRDWAWKEIKAAANDDGMINAYLEMKKWNDDQGDWRLQFVPTSKPALLEIIKDLLHWAGMDAPQAAGDEMPEDIAKQIITVPRSGMKKADYLQNPDSIKSLYDAAKSGDDSSRKRLFGMARDWKPEPWKRPSDGKVFPVSAQDIQCREALDRFLDWEDKKEN